MARGRCVVCWFLCLLRTEREILTLKVGRITLCADSGVAFLTLLASKGAKLKNAGESIVVSDPTARALLAFLCRDCSPQDQVIRLFFQKVCSSALIAAAAAFGYRSSNLLPHSLRRGGATFHFARSESIDFGTHFWALGPRYNGA